MIQIRDQVPYPSHRVVDVGLRDGSTIRVRPVKASDGPDLLDLFDRISNESNRFRFHGLRHVTSNEIASFVDVDYSRRFGLVGETSMGDEHRLIALASYVAVEDGIAEVAFLVDDPFQGRGIASILTEHLAEAASEAGIATFRADIMSGNADMLEVVRALELPLRSTASAGVVHCEFPTSPTPEAIEAFERREAIAAAAGVARFLSPSSIAVIGASRRRETIGGAVFRNLIDGAFNGPVYPVNPNAPVIQSVPAYRSVLDIPERVDLAVIVVPAEAVLQAAGECAARDVRALLIISSGFAETDETGRDRQSRLLEMARAHGMRIVGPNCMGVLNTDPSVSMNATFSPVAARRGRLGFMSQSGALGIAVIDRAAELGLGLSSFVSVGNKADISGNDLLQYWEQDDATDVALLYLESFGNPRKFARVARRVSRKKPIVAVKSGRSQAGARAAASHTGSLVAGDAAVEALFQQAGVIRTETLEELFDVANLLAHQPVPKGEKVAILTNAGGLGILCADACEAGGLSVPLLADETVESLRSLLADEAGVSNPVDMIASATAEQYGRALELLAADPNVDAIIVIFIPPLVTRAEDVAHALMHSAEKVRQKTLLACFLGTQGIHEMLQNGNVLVPSFSFPESAARALSRVAKYGVWKHEPEGHIPELAGIHRAEALGLVSDALRRSEGWVDPVRVSELLSLYGIPSVRSRAASTPVEVAHAASEIGRPVAVKIVSERIVHKTDVGGVRLDLATPDEARRAAEAITRSLADQGFTDEPDGFLVQEMVSAEGSEMFVGMSHDPSFGPLLACGVGGTLVELLRDVSVRITPLTDKDVKEMLRHLNTWPLFEGYRGRPPLDRAAFEDLLLRVSAMVEDLPHLAELDLNPVLVAERDGGCVVLDARIRVAVPEPELPRGARTRPRPPH